jgi:phosphatidylserine/phosphatidylglycerophosphate/cardiolipin synthase-like enzyme
MAFPRFIFTQRGRSMKRSPFDRRLAMCFDYEWEYHLKRAEEARKEMQRTEEQRKKQPSAPAGAPASETDAKDPIPA